ncbi:MAG: helix-turn-helix domain-containing protein [Chloroflexota bacterium]
MTRRRGGQRASDQARPVGKDVRTARIAAGASKAHASRRAGVSRSTWERVEQGSPHTTLATLCAVTDAVGLDLVIRAYPGRGPSLRDRGQATIAQYLATEAHAAWKIGIEVTSGDFGQATDQVLYGPTEIAAVEIIRHMGDFQGQYRAASLKRDWLARQHRRPVRLVLAVEDLRSNRMVLGPHVTLLGSVLPAGSRQVMQAIRSGTPLGSDGLLWIRRPRRLDRSGTMAPSAKVLSPDDS